MESEVRTMDKEDMILEELRKLNTKVDTMQQDISQLKGDVSQLKEDVAQLKEDAEITRSGVNSLLEWAEDVSNAIRFPLPKVK